MNNPDIMNSVNNLMSDPNMMNNMMEMIKNNPQLMEMAKNMMDNPNILESIMKTKESFPENLNNESKLEFESENSNNENKEEEESKIEDKNLEKNTKVKIKDLKKKEYNDKIGLIEDYIKSKDRYVVYIESLNKKLLLKQKNCEIV